MRFHWEGRMSLAEILNLTIAFRRIQQDKRDDVWPDIVGYRDYDRELDGNLQNLRDQLENTISYRASLPLGIEIPKRGFTLRPGIVPLIDDRLLYQAIADLYAPHFNAESCVYSNRLTSYPNSNRMFLPGVELWLAFQDKVEQFCDECPYVVETDITAYFDHINHDLLIHRIDDLFQSSIDKATLRESKQVLQRLLQRWSTGFYRFGIPQVNDASSFFGNMYLDELDKWMSRRGYVFLRYVDDIRIFTKDEPGARRALVDLIIKLREMGLYLAAGKTKIEESAEVSERLGQERHEIKTIETELDSGVKERIEGATHLLEDFFIRLVEDPNQFNDRHFRYCINRFKKAKASNLGEEIHNRVIEEIQ